MLWKYQEPGVETELNFEFFEFYHKSFNKKAVLSQGNRTMLL